MDIATERDPPHQNQTYPDVIRSSAQNEQQTFKVVGADAHEKNERSYRSSVKSGFHCYMERWIQYLKTRRPYLALDIMKLKASTKDDRLKNKANGSRPNSAKIIVMMTV